ncbi:S-layer homology domain-containing protein, partial [Mycobacterium tuberculosis]
LNEPNEPNKPSEDPDTVVTPEEPAVALSDIKYHWAAQQIEKAVQRQIVKGYPDGTFKPDAAASRAEFIVMLMNAMKLGTEGAALGFTDSGQIGDWARQAVARAVEAEIINGYEDGSFRPGARITRAEVVVMIGRALGLSPAAGDSTGFADEDDIPQWARGIVAIAHDLGIVNGRGNNRFNPNEQATRAEVITILLRILEIQERDRHA